MRTTAELPDLHAVVTTVWAIAVLVHLLGNPATSYGTALPSPAGVVPAVTAVLAAVTALRPGHRATAVATTATVWLLAAVRLPVLANNLVLLGVVGTALVISADRRLAVRAVVWSGAAAYAFAALAKYNTGFLDLDSSCAPVLLGRLLASWGLGPAPGWLAGGSPVLTIAVESAVALGLLVPRLRRHAALLGVVFHGLLAYDLAQHFWDFTAALLPVFAAASPAVAVVLAARARRLVRTLVARSLLVLLAGVAALSSAPVHPGWFLLVGHLVWLSAGSALVLGWVVVHLRRRPWRVVEQEPGAAPGWTIPAVALVALVIVNGLTPYVQVKTGYGWNMYANLRVVDDRSNHLFVPALDLRGDHDVLLAVTGGTAPGVDHYVDMGARLPLVQVEDWVARTAGASVVTTAPDGTIRTFEHDTVTRSVPAWVVRVAPLRPITDTCLLSYGPAG